MGPELELLLLCARTRLDARRIDRIRVLLQLGVNWNDLCNMAQRHGVESLLFHSLKASSPEMVPPKIWEQLHNHFLTMAARNLFLTQELIKIYNLFQKNGVALIPFKGPALASYAYGDLSLRPFGDLDILIHPQDIPRANHLLVAQGYRWLSRLSPAQKEIYLRAASATFTFQHNNQRTLLELDPYFSADELPCPVPLERFWDRLEQTSLEDQWIAAFSPEDLLLLLCLHGTKHFWERLIWICDVAELIHKKTEINWGRVLREAQTLHCMRLVLIGLSLAHDLLGATLPEEIERKIKVDPRAAILARQVKERLSPGNDVPPGLFTGSFFLLRASDRLQDQVRYCFRATWLPTFLDWELLPLPPFFYFFYSLIRPFRLAVRYEMAFLNRILG